MLVLAPKPVDAVFEPKPPPPPKAGAAVVLAPPKREDVPVAPKAGLLAAAPNAPPELPNPNPDVSLDPTPDVVLREDNVLLGALGGPSSGIVNVDMFGPCCAIVTVDASRVGPTTTSRSR